VLTKATVVAYRTTLSNISATNPINRKVMPMIFYNGFNLMIDIILVTTAVYYTRWATIRNKKLTDLHELDYEYNQGWEAGYNQALRNKNEWSKS
jgi:hypothetical protein